MSVLKPRIGRFAAWGAMLSLIVSSLTLGLMTAAQAVPVRVTGNVIDPAGNGVESVIEVYLETPAGSGTYDQVDSVVAAAGAIDLDLDPGNYKFEVTPRGQDFLGEWYNDAATEATAAVVPVSASVQLPNVVLAPRPSIVGAVIDPAGLPIRGARVTAWLPGNPAATPPTYDRILTTVYSKVDGTFSVPMIGLSPGVTTVKLHFYPDNRPDLAGEWYNNMGSIASAEAVPIGANVGAVQLTGGGSISGVVTSDAGVPLEQVLVSADGAGGTGLGEDYTDANGAYIIEHLPTDNYEVFFSDSHINEYRAEMFNNSDGTTPPTLVPVGVDASVSAINAALTPKAKGAPVGVDVSGTVTDQSGKPLIGVEVRAWNVADKLSNAKVAEVAVTNRSGTYNLTHLESRAGTPTFKLVASGYAQREKTSYGVGSAWFNQRGNYAGATPVTITPPTPVAANFSLTVYGGVSGTVTSVIGKPVVNSIVRFYDADDQHVGSALARPDGTYDTYDLKPGTYQVHFESTDHLDQWWQGANSADARTITVKSGTMLTGINAAMTNVLKATTRPEIGGKPYVKKRLVADPGVWNNNGTATFSYEWLIKGVVVGVGPTYEPKKSDIGKKVVLRVTNDTPSDFTGSAISKATQKIGWMPKIKLKKKGLTGLIKIKNKKVKAKKVKGTIIIKLGKLTIAKAKVKKGKAKVSLRKLRKGKNKVTIIYKAKKPMGSIEIKKKIKR